MGTRTRDGRRELAEAIAGAIAPFVEAIRAVDEAAAAQLGVNVTDLRCLATLAARGPMTPGTLAAARRLSGAATSTAIDRLERASYARRLPDARDRRSVRVALTDRARARLDEANARVQVDVAALLADYTADELRAVLDFLERGRTLPPNGAVRPRPEPAPRRAENRRP
jgi:DNA-binding MarR family transcriptional regulator